MDGKDLLRRLRELLDEDSNSGWLDERTCYDFFYEAACDFVDRSECLRGQQTLTTVASTGEYNLSPDFLRLYLRDAGGDYFLKYSDGTTIDFIRFAEYQDIYYQTSQATSKPTRFTIIDADLPTVITSTATSNGASSGGASRLTDTASDFSDVSAGDTVHNTTDGSTGIVLQQVSTTVLKTALFGGTNNDWTSADAYIVQPGARYKIVVDPLPTTSGHSIYVPYIQRPAPVYDDYGVYRFVNPSALVKYAFWLFKYRDREPNFGDAMYKFWEAEIDKKSGSINRGQRPGGFTVNFRKRK